jgi:3-methyladenine DNA glycosylase AlkD
MKTASNIKKSLLTLATPTRAKTNAWFFKTGKGQYGEGDVFVGVTVPQVRSIVKNVSVDISLTEVQELLRDTSHEVRLCALLILVKLFQKSQTKAEKKRLFDFYTKHTKYINNWDLVDTSAHIIVGQYISDYMEHEERVAFINKYIASKSLWENRIIVVATLYQIKKRNEKMIFYIAERLFLHTHDLMHKAIGWMLREVGKASGEKVLQSFLSAHIKQMPRTTLRYAIERFPEITRKKYLAIK